MPESLAGGLALLATAAPFLILLAATWMAGWVAEQTAGSFGVSRVAIAELTPIIALSAFVAGRLVAAVPYWRMVVIHPLDLLRFNGSWSLPGALAGAIGALVICRWRTRLPLFAIADVYGMAAPLAVAVYGLGCLVRSDCYGRPAPPPFGILFPAMQVPRYPVELYAASAAFLTYACLRAAARRVLAPGTIALLAIAMLATERALFDIIRLRTDHLPVSPDQIGSLSVAALAVVALVGVGLRRHRAMARSMDVRLASLSLAAERPTRVRSEP